MRARWYRLALSPPRYVRAVLRDGQLFVFVVESPHTPVAWWQSFLEEGTDLWLLLRVERCILTLRHDG